MRYIAKDGKEFENLGEAQAYEKGLDISEKGTLCFNQIKDCISVGTMYVANIKESDGNVASTLIIYNPEGIENGLREAIIMSAYGEPVVFDAKSFTYNPVYTVDTVKSKHTKLIEQIAESLTGGIKTYRVTGSYIVLNDVVIYAKELPKVASMIESYLVESEQEDVEKPFFDLLSLLFGI